jgi:hypothetical protein
MPAFALRPGLVAGSLLLAAAAHAGTDTGNGAGNGVTVYAAGDIARCPYPDPA